MWFSHKLITDKIIITQVKESVYFSILCDKTTDLAQIGQISLSVGYISKHVHKRKLYFFYTCI